MPFLRNNRRFTVGTFALLGTLGTAALGVGAFAWSQPEIRFVDTIRQSGIDFRHVNGASGSKYLVEITGSGCGFVDFDNDGYLDIFLVNGGATPGFRSEQSLNHALYRNNHDGTFTDVTKKAGILDNRAFGMGVAAADYDNDGFTDLYITNFGGPNLLYHNNGNGTFSEVAAQAGVRGNGDWSSSAAFLDYDRDGYLDLYVAHYTDHSFNRNYICPVGNPPEKSYCSPKVYNGVASSLFHNNRDGTFTDVGAKAGVALAEGKGLGVVAADLDGDGWVDIYVANDQVRNFLFHNNHDGTFSEVGMNAGVALDANGRAQAGMGTDVGDYDNDGRFDIVVSNLDNEYLALYRKLDGEGFEDVSSATGLAVATRNLVGFGAGFLDFDNDGLLDLFVANGNVIDNPELIAPGRRFAQPKLLLHNTGKGFQDVTAQSGADLLTPKVSRGAAFGDFDNDGDIDVLVNNSGGYPQLLRNDGGNRNNWLVLKLRGTRSNRSGLGARIEVLAAGKRRVFQTVGGASIMAANDPRVHIGLGARASVDELIVHWPSGLVDRIKNVAARQILTIVEGSSITSIASRPFGSSQANGIPEATRSSR
jgi:enediyne biosynthesis protein E4